MAIIKRNRHASIIICVSILAGDLWRSLGTSLTNVTYFRMDVEIKLGRSVTLEKKTGMEYTVFMNAWRKTL